MAQVGPQVGRTTLHPTGPDLSALVWGSWRALERDETATPDGLARVIAACIDLGITSFDLADVYGGYRIEALFGDALRAWGGDRCSIEIITKCGVMLPGAGRPEIGVYHYDAGGDHIRRSLDRSLKALGIDQVDVFLIHRADLLMDADEAADALHDALRFGKARHVGVSNCTPSQVELLQSRLQAPLVTNQVQVSPLHPDPLFDGTLDQAQRLRMRPMIWSPLGGGRLLTGEGERERKVRDALLAAGAEQGCDDVAALALAWVMRHPSRPVPVLGSGRLDRLAGMARAGDLRFDRPAWYRVLEAGLGRRLP